MLGKNIYIFLIFDTKLHDSLTLAQFKIEGFSTPHRYPPLPVDRRRKLNVHKSSKRVIYIQFTSCVYRV